MENKPAQNIQDSFLNTARKERTSITIYLLSGVKLTGRIRSFDKYSVVLETNNQEQLIFKHAISTVVMGRLVQSSHAEPRPAGTPPSTTTELTPATTAGTGTEGQGVSDLRSPDFTLPSKEGSLSANHAKAGRAEDPGRRTGKASSARALSGRASSGQTSPGQPERAFLVGLAYRTVRRAPVGLKGDKGSLTTGALAAHSSVVSTLARPKLPNIPEFSAEESLDELHTLATSAGAQVVGEFLQRRDRPDPATLIGRGKLEEIAGAAASVSADLILFDHDLSASQQRNIEKVVETRVIDRTQVILDIFARHARTREGQLQVELAQLEYLLPRLAGRGVEMSQLGGGIGTRGPGETQLETDRRKIYRRIRHVKQQLENVP